MFGSLQIYHLGKKVLEANGYTRSRQGLTVRLNATRPDLLPRASRRNMTLIMVKPCETGTL